MANLQTLLIPIAAVTISITSCNDSGNEKEPASAFDTVQINNQKAETAIIDTVQPAKPDYSDLSVFWKDFKEAASKKDYKKIEEMSLFPFFAQNNNLEKEEFEDFTFSELILSALKTATPPVKSSFWIGKYKEGSLYEVNCGGPAIYFTKQDNEWKFAGIMYGE